MPRIAEYARRSHASEFIGAPTVERKSEITQAVAEGLSQVSSAMVSRDKALAAQQLATSKQQAATANYQFQEKYYQTLVGTAEQQGLVDQYTQDPAAIPDAAITMGEEMTAAFASELQNEETRAEFTRMNQNFLIGERKRLSLRAATQIRNNQVAAMEEGGLTLANSAAHVDGEDGILNVVEGIYDNQFVVDTSNANIGPGARQDGFLRYTQEAKRKFINGQLDRNALGFAQELLEGKYSSLIINGEEIPFIDAKERKTLISDAREIVKNQEEQFNFDFAIRNGELGTSLAKADAAGELSYSEVDDLEFDARSAGQTKIADMYASYKQAMAKSNDSRRATDKVWLTSKMLELAEINKSGWFDSDRTKADRVDRIFDMVREANDKYTRGELSTKDRSQYMDSLNKYVLKSLKSQKETQEPYFIGMNEIHKSVMNLPLPASEQVNALYDAMQDYDLALSKANLNGEETTQQAQDAAKLALKSLGYRLYPERGALQIGSVVNTPMGQKQVKGFDEFGNPAFVELNKQDLEKLNAR